MSVKKLRVPDGNDKHEFAGRMYEALDIQLAIESGQLKTLDDVLQAVKDSAASISQLLKAETWVVSDTCCVDIPASINQAAN